MKTISDVVKEKKMVIFDFLVKELESLYRELIIILRKCAAVTKLPAKQKVNPLTFTLKNIELDNPSRDETSQEEGSDLGKLNCPNLFKKHCGTKAL